ncbi:hypothetical protein [Oceaniglobus trochenteri]|uniref:hypothetical protein n=1 Tax=Oceaniglobus trochenteri TaxID=2763260 RepID=UPI001CFF8E7F|nr:hypothetical protein [Oceaniglobus trochenteri]
MKLHGCATRAFATLAATLAIGGAAQAQQDGARPKNVTLLGIQSATVAPSGLAFASLSGTTDRVGPGDDIDGSLALGFGLGNAQTGIGLQFTGQITSLTDSFADSGYFEIKASRQIVGGSTPTYLGLSVDGGGFGDASGRDTGGKITLTSFRHAQFSEGGDYFPLMFTLGAGTNIRNNESDPGIFGGVGIGLTPNLGVSAAWSGEYVNVGASFRFDQAPNLEVATTLYDAFDQENSRRLGISVSYFVADLF